MVNKRIMIDDPLGIHLRPAGALCEAAIRFESDVRFEYGVGKTANAKSLISVLAASVKCGDEINLICDGKDEEDALKEVEDALKCAFTY